MTDYEFVKNVILLSPSRIGHVSMELRAFLIPADKKYVWEFNKEEFRDLLNLHKDEIKTRPDPESRAEDWECFDIAGYKSPPMRKRLIDSRRNIAPRKTTFVDNRAKRELVESVPGATIGDFDLIISEIQLNQDSKYELLRSKARLLGLIKS